MVPHLEVPNRFQLDGGDDFWIEDLPDPNAIFRSEHPPAPYRVAPDGWDERPLHEKRMTLGIAYAEHPVAGVRKRTIERMRGERSKLMAQTLVNLLCDENAEVRKAAAACLWDWFAVEDCRFAVLALRDEIRGYTEMVPGYQSREGLFLGHEAAVEALDFLVASAPTDAQREAVRRIVDEEVIIEERIRDVDTRSVRFVGKEQKGKYTYEVYRAKNKAQALAFLKTKTVDAEFYYIEVETMEGNVGRDLDGIYEI